MADTIEAGDTVMVKSGGPVMTVEWLGDSGKSAMCCWFDGPNAYEQKFYVSALKKVNPEDYA